MLVAFWLISVTQLLPAQHLMAEEVASYVSEDAWKLHFNSSLLPVVPNFSRHLPKFEVSLEVDCTWRPDVCPKCPHELGYCPNDRKSPPKEQIVRMSISPGQKATIQQVKTRSSHVLNCITLFGCHRHLTT